MRSLGGEGLTRARVHGAQLVPSSAVARTFKSLEWQQHFKDAYAAAPDEPGQVRPTA